MPPKITICLIIVAGCATGRLAVADTQENESDRCALCHEQDTKDWAASAHARAVNPEFLAIRKQQGDKWECLVCHTSQYDRQTGQFSHQGVSCESCHGPAKEDHPDKAKMALPVTSEVCQSCHSITYGEWRVSAHGQKNVRCFDCHKMHGMALRKDDPDQMCGTCHAEQLQDFTHATHHSQGLHCLTCHMPELSPGGLKIEGIGGRGHTFTVGAETCIRCHRDRVHQNNEAATLEQEVARLKSANPEALEKKVGSLEGQTTRLQADLQANQRVLVPLIALAFLLGIFCGYALPRFRARKQDGDPGAPRTQSANEQPPDVKKP
jgi:hypothetical protein